MITRCTMFQQHLKSKFKKKLLVDKTKNTNTAGKAKFDLGIFYNEDYSRFLTIKDFKNLTSISKYFSKKYEDTIQNLLIEYNLKEDYTMYLKSSMQDDFGLISNYSLHELFRKFSINKQSVLNIINSLILHDEECKKLLLHKYLMKETAKGNFIAVYYLLKAGAPISHSKFNTFPITNWSAWRNNPCQGSGSSIYAAAYSGSLACMLLFFESLKNVNLKNELNYRKYFLNNEKTLPLHYFVIPTKRNNYYNHKIVTLLINHEMHIDQEIQENGTPFHHAIREFPLTMLMLQASFNDKPADVDELNKLKKVKYQLLNDATIDLDWDNKPNLNEQAFQVFEILLNFKSDINKKYKGYDVIEFAKFVTEFRLNKWECNRQGYDKEKMEKFMHQSRELLVNYLINKLQQQNQPEIKRSYRIGF